jgi:hypothetical protein
MNKPTYKFAYQILGSSIVLVGENTFPSPVHASEFPSTLLEDGSLVFPLEDGHLIYTDVQPLEAKALVECGS